MKETKTMTTPTKTPINKSFHFDLAQRLHCLITSPDFERTFTRIEQEALDTAYHAVESASHYPD